VTAAWADGTALPWTAGVTWDQMRGRFPFDLPAQVGGGRQVRDNADVHSVGAYAAATVPAAGGRLDLRIAPDALARGLPGRGYAPSLHARQRQNQSRASAAWLTRSASADARIVLAIARQQIRHHDADPPFGTPYDDTTHVHSLELRAEANRSVSTATTFGIGAELRHLTVRSSVLAATAGNPALDAGILVHGEQTVPHRRGQFRIAAQLRADRDPHTHDWTPSHSLTAGWSARGLVVHLAHRSAFSPPTLGDRFFREGVGVAPNPDLRAERVPADVEAGIRLHLERRAGTASIRATAFRGDIRGMILWAPDFRFLWSPYNADVKRFGIETALALASRSGRFRLDAAWSAMRATYDRDADDDAVQIAYRPRHTASVATRFTLFATQFSSEMRYLGQRNTAPTHVNRLDGFWTLDAALSRAWHFQHWNLGLELRVDRIRNEKDALIFAFPVPGRTVTLGLRFGPAAPRVPLR
jgi:iron complex outermembrane receptor protein